MSQEIKPLAEIPSSEANEASSEEEAFHTTLPAVTVEEHNLESKESPPKDKGCGFWKKVCVLSKNYPYLLLPIFAGLLTMVFGFLNLDQQWFIYISKAMPDKSAPAHYSILLFIAMTPSTSILLSVLEKDSIGKETKDLSNYFINNGIAASMLLLLTSTLSSMASLKSELIISIVTHPVFIAIWSTSLITCIISCMWWFVLYWYLIAQAADSNTNKT